MNHQLRLYQRDDCCLCDQALDLLAQVRCPAFDSVFIDDDAALEARYGLRVPVLRDQRSGAELAWPFEIGRLAAWLEGVRRAADHSAA
ncbi:MAG: glutaredoxin family protein [Pseudoxanthomonas sp.]